MTEEAKLSRAVHRESCIALEKFCLPGMRELCRWCDVRVRVMCATTLLGVEALPQQMLPTATTDGPHEGHRFTVGRVSEIRKDSQSVSHSFHGNSPRLWTDFAFLVPRAVL